MKKILLIGSGFILFGVLIAVGAFVLVTAQTENAIRREWQTTQVEKIQNLGATRTFEILPLFEEATSREDLELEHGVSYLVKTDQMNILLDVGMNPARLSHNMQALGVGEKDFDVVLITHLHPDHMGGTQAWWSNILVAGDPPLALAGKRVLLPGAVSNTGLDSIVITQPQKIAQGVATLGTIAFSELFPLSLKSARNAEQGLAVNVEGKGIVLITGCGHPTIERIVARAQAALDEPIVGIVGGFHYEGLTREQAQAHISFVDALHPELVALSPHDSSTAALDAFREAFRQVYREIRVGERIRFDESLASGPR